MDSFPLECLCDKNKVQGYATWQMIHALAPYESSNVSDQAAGILNQSVPQTIVAYWGSKGYPEDHYKWSVRILIDPQVPFGKQTATLSHLYPTGVIFDDEEHFQKDFYDVTLDQLIRILPLLKKKSKRRLVLRALQPTAVRKYVFDLTGICLDDGEAA